MSSPIVDIYCRLASEEPVSTSLDQQEAACRAYCLEYGLTTSVIYRDVSSSSQYRDRTGLEVIRRRCLQGEIQGVNVCWPNRLLRNQ